MELTVLAAWIGFGGECGKQSAVEPAAGERRRQFFQIDGGKMRLDSGIDHITRKRRRWLAPYRKYRRDSGSGKLPLAISPDVLQKEIAEDHMRHAGRLGVGYCCGHLVFVDPVRARVGNTDDKRRQSGRIELRVQQLLAHAVHADTAEGLRDRGQRSDDIELAGAARLVQRPGAVLAA